MNFKANIFVLILLFSALNSFSQNPIGFHNCTDKPVYVAVGDPQLSGVTVKGWYKLVPGETKTLLNNIPNAHTFWWFAKSGDKIWEGSHDDISLSFLVDTTSNEFSIAHVAGGYRWNSTVDKESNSNYEWHYFRLARQCQATIEIED